MRQFLGIRTPEQTERSARWIRCQQRADGSWANFHGRARRPVDDRRGLRRAAAGRRRPGGAAHGAGAGVRARAAAGSKPPGSSPGSGWRCSASGRWDDLPAMPPELVFLPRWFPLNVYDWACWARQTVVPLTLVGALRPARDAGVTLAELRTGTPPAGAGSAADQLDGRVPAARPGAARLRAPRRSGPLRGAGAAPGARSGSSPGRRPTAPGAASSRRGSTR